MPAVMAITIRTVGRLETANLSLPSLPCFLLVFFSAGGYFLVLTTSTSPREAERKGHLKKQDTNKSKLTFIRILSSSKLAI